MIRLDILDSLLQNSVQAAHLGALIYSEDSPVKTALQDMMEKQFEKMM